MTDCFEILEMEEYKRRLSPAFDEEATEAFLYYATIYGGVFSTPKNPIAGKYEKDFIDGIKTRNEKKAALAALYYFLTGVENKKTAQFIKRAVEKEHVFIEDSNQTTLFELLPENLQGTYNREEALEEVLLTVVNAFTETLPLNLSAIPQTDFTYLATSKANRLQPEISKDREKAEISVGTPIKPAKIELKILTPDNMPITPKERELQEAIGALMQKCQDKTPVFTIDQIYKELAGLETDAFIKPAKRKEIEETIDRLRRTEVYIDYKDQVLNHKLEIDERSLKIEGYAIMAFKVDATYKGRTATGYQMTALPPIYRYSSNIKQISKVNNKLLNTTADAAGEDSRKNTDDYIVLKRVILKMIEHMKSEKERNKGKYENRRSYKTIFREVLGTEEPTAKKSRIMREDIDNYLELLKKQGYISGHEKYKTGRALTGVKVKL